MSAGPELWRQGEEGERLAELLAVESTFWARGLRHIAGVDEAGRGPLAGPVLAAAVIMPPGEAIPLVNDSKRLSRAVREKLAAEILRRAVSVGIGAASVREVDRLNILRATHLAMCRAVRRLQVAPEHILVDGLPVPALGPGHTAVVEGDRRVHSVACASIVAKVTRDRLMRRLAARYPGYGWERNAGYDTREHREALARLGPTPHHRRSFGPVQLHLELGEGVLGDSGRGKDRRHA
ncbi:MAG TPA: ribonuclease HII [Longimicrobiales bacterium]